MALQLSSTYKNIAEELIDRYDIAFGHIELDKVLFLVEDERSPKKYADIRSVGHPYTFLTGYKFIITFYEPKMITLSEAQKVMVVYHELLHIHSDFKKLRKHDVEDFMELVAKYGATWAIDPNLPNLLEDEEGPIQNDSSTTDDLDEPDIF